MWYNRGWLVAGMRWEHWRFSQLRERCMSHLFMIEVEPMGVEWVKREASGGAEAEPLGEKPGRIHLCTSFTHNLNSKKSNCMCSQVLHTQGCLCWDLKGNAVRCCWAVVARTRPVCAGLATGAAARVSASKSKWVWRAAWRTHAIHTLYHLYYIWLP